MLICPLKAPGYEVKTMSPTNSSIALEARCVGRCFSRHWALARVDPVAQLGELPVLDGVAVILASHALEQVSRLCDRAVVLDHGQIAWTGPAAQVMRGFEEVTCPN